MDHSSSLNKIDIEIIRLHQDDHRSLPKLAKNLNVAAGTIYKHINKLQKTGILKGYTVKVDSEKLGYNLTAIRLVQIDGNFHSKVEKEITEFNDVIAVNFITGEYDLLRIKRFRSEKALYNFCLKNQKVPSVKKS